ncbi:hypothetical protein ARMSODRAFT_1025391 [Armillaria solidipes]|uniref:Uncharacterized protein n=1 Tax=Armillaria solidipes TaxID=1076256 RepID=A0A2H3AWE4_9AGAR|nr:hypothetical protein ARMSODRAFT_1025391 [Armillaria solidipes]
MISDQEFLKSIPPGKLRFLVAAMLHKQKRSALKLPLKKVEVLLKMVEHLKINWMALAHPARHKMDRVTMVVAEFLQKNPKYRPWGVKPVSPDSSLSALATTPPQSEPDLSQPLNPTPSSTPPVPPPEQPMIVTPPKTTFAKKKLYKLVGLVPIARAKPGPIGVRLYHAKHLARKGCVAAIEAASPFTDCNAPDTTAAVQLSSLSTSLPADPSTPIHPTISGGVPLEPVREPLDNSDVEPNAHPADILPERPWWPHIFDDHALFPESSIPPLDEDDSWRSPISDLLHVDEQADWVVGDSNSPADPAAFDDLLRAIIQGLESNPPLLDSSLQRSVPVSDDAASGEVQDTHPPTTSTSCEPSTHLNDHPRQTTTGLQRGAVVDESALQDQPMSPTIVDLPLEPAGPTATVDESTLQDQPMSPKTIDPSPAPTSPTAAIDESALEDESPKTPDPTPAPASHTATVAAADIKSAPEGESVSPKSVDLPVGPASLVDTSALEDERPQTFDPPLGPASSTAAVDDDAPLQAAPSPPFIDLRKYLAQSRRRPPKPSTKVRKPAPSIDPVGTAVSVASGAPSAPPIGEKNSANHEKQGRCTQHSSEDKSTDSDSSDSDNTVQQEHSIAQPVSDSVFSVVVSRSHQEGGLQGLSIPIFPQGAKTLHGRTYIKLQDVMDFIMRSDWSIPEPQSEKQTVGIHLTTTSLSHPHDRFVGWGQVDPEDREVFAVQAPYAPSTQGPASASTNQASALPVWLPIQTISNSTYHQLGLCFKIWNRNWVDQQQPRDDHAEIAYIGPEKTDRGWFILPSPRTDGEKRAVPPESVKKSVWQATVCIIDNRSDTITRLSSRMPPEWYIKDGVCYFKGFLILRAVQVAVPPPEESQQLGVFLPGAAGEKLYLGFVDVNDCHLPQHAWRVHVPVTILGGAPQMTCFVVMGRPEALLKYDTGLTDTPPSHLVRQQTKEVRWSIPPQLLASIQCDDLYPCRKELPQLLDASYDKSLIHEVTMCWVQQDAGHYYTMPVLLGHWMIMDGTYYVSMHHLIDWTAHSERLKLPSLLSDQGVHIAALKVDGTKFEWVFVGMGTRRSEGVLQFQPPAKFTQDATVWVTLHYEDNFFQYFCFHPEPLSHMETLSSREHFQPDKRSRPEKRYYMRPGDQPVSDPPDQRTASRAHINGTILTQQGEITGVFRSWTIHGGVAYICGIKVLTRLLEMPAIEAATSPLGVSLETPKSTLFLGLLYPTQHKVVGPKAVSETPTDQAVFVGIPITMTEVGRGEVRCRVWPCAHERIKGGEISGVDQSHFKRLYPDKDSSLGYWFIPRSHLSSTPPIREQKQVHGVGPSPSTQPQWARGLEGPKALSDERTPDTSSNRPTEKPNVKEGRKAEKRGDTGESKAGKSTGDPIRKPAKRRAESAGAGPDAERSTKKPRVTSEERSAKVKEALRESRYHERGELKPLWERPERKAMPLQQTLALGKAMWDALQHTSIAELPAADLIGQEYHDIRINMEDWMKYFAAGRSWLTNMKFIGRHMQDHTVNNILTRLHVERRFGLGREESATGIEPTVRGVVEVRNQLDKLLGVLGDD